MTYNDWKAAAIALRQTLTDSVIAASIAQLPPQIVAVSGAEIIKKLKRRRDNLERDAARYYRVLAKSVDVNGTAGKEHFEVKRGTKGETILSVYRVDEQGEKEAAPYYRRIFNNEETSLITIYGFSGDDVFDLRNEGQGIQIIVEKSINKRQVPVGEE
jgi:hypothetical protein